MKTLMIAISLLLTATLSTSAQVAFPKGENGKIVYTEVVTVDSANASKLYSNAKRFIANAFVSAKDVIQLADDQTKSVVVKGLIPVTWKGYPYGDVRTKVTIQCKDGRYKYEVTDLVHEYTKMQHNYSGGSLENEKPECGTFNLPKKLWENIQAGADERIKVFISNMKQQMATSKDKDW